MFGSLLAQIVKSLGLSTMISLVESTLLSEAASLGETGIERAVEIPDSTVASICAKSGADHRTAIQYRDDAAKAEGKFLIYLTTGQLPADDQITTAEVLANG